MLTKVFGLISPEALTTVDKSSRRTFPVCTVATFLPLWCTVKAMIATSTSRATTPMAAFFQAFMFPITLLIFRPLILAPAKSCGRRFANPGALCPPPTFPSKGWFWGGGPGNLPSNEREHTCFYDPGGGKVPDQERDVPARVRLPRKRYDDCPRNET